MNTLLKEFELISLISEDADERIMSGFFYESASSSDGRGIIKKAIDKINEIINNMKKFINDIKKKMQDRRDEKKLKIMMNDTVNRIDCEFHDADISRACKIICDINMKAVKELKSIDDAYEKGRISASEAMDRMNEITNQVQTKIKQLEDSDRAFKRGKVKLESKKPTNAEAAVYFQKVDVMLKSATEKISNSCQSEAEKTAKLLRKQDKKDERIQERANVKAKLTSCLSKVQRFCSTPLGKISVVVGSIVLVSGVERVTRGARYNRAVNNATDNHLKRVNEIKSSDKKMEKEREDEINKIMKTAGLSKEEAIKIADAGRSISDRIASELNEENSRFNLEKERLKTKYRRL